jgi:RNA polymerase sigma-70 factor (ECF subfamily)
MPHPAYDQELSIPPVAPPSERWVDEHGDALYRYAVARVRAPHLAEDLVQDTLLAALQSHRRFEGKCSERTWLISILKHKVLDHFRKAGRELLLDADVLLADERGELFHTTGFRKGHWRPETGPTAWNMDPAATLEQQEFWRTIRDCVEELPPRMGRAFWMREVEGFDSKEICKALEISATNLWVMLHRARLHLRQRLASTWFDSQSLRADPAYAAVQ